MQIAGWGRYPVAESELVTARSPAEAHQHTVAHAGLIARGNGRAYGDAAIGHKTTLGLRQMDRVLSFDAETGLLSAEAGMLLADVIDVFLPRGWFPHVVPGTRFVTLGGAIASDVHGKNHHHEGGFGDYTHRLTVAFPDGQVLEATRSKNPDLFRATIGGMGLTGTILTADISLRPVSSSWMRQRTVVAPDIETAMAELIAGEAATYSVAWIDCLAQGRSLGRSLVFLGEHAEADDLPLGLLPVSFGGPRVTVPFDMPSIVLNPLSQRAFNAVYYARGARLVGREILTPINSYFFPLDGVLEWNRIYGKRGFLQHQCVLPHDTAARILPLMLKRIAERGDASVLAVLKTLGPASGLLSFPMPGFTLALDFAFRPDLLEFLDELDGLVVEGGGRIYLAKDARQSRNTFSGGYPELGRFVEFRRAIGAEERIRSRLSDRLGV